MSTINPFHMLDSVRHSFVTWRDRVNSRNELRNLGDRTLRDIGLSRGYERPGSAKPFWIP